MKNYYLILKITATMLLLAQRWYFGPVGAGAAICDAIVILAIWRHA